MPESPTPVEYDLEYLYDVASKGPHLKVDRWAYLTDVDPNPDLRVLTADDKVVATGLDPEYAYFLATFNPMTVFTLVAEARVRRTRAAITRETIDSLELEIQMLRVLLDKLGMSEEKVDELFAEFWEQREAGNLTFPTKTSLRLVTE